MFNWLFKKKLTQEQQIAKEVEDVVQTMKESLEEAGRWEVKVVEIVETYSTGLGDIRGVFHKVYFTDTQTGWKMTVTVGDDSPWYVKEKYFKCKFLKQEEKLLVADEVFKLPCVGHRKSASAHNHEEFAYLPSSMQLISLFEAWWWMAVFPEANKLYEQRKQEKEQKEMQTKREGLGKLKAMYGKEKK